MSEENDLAIVRGGSDLCRKLAEALGFGDRKIVDVDLHFHLNDAVRMTTVELVGAGKIKRFFELLKDGSWRSTE
jgi:hypothetical protein